MSTKRQTTTTVAPAAKPSNQTDPAIYAATYWRSALRMATLRALVVIGGMVAIGSAVGAVLVYESTLSAAAGLVLLAVIIGTWSIALNGYTSAVARATWYQMEQVLGEDLDDDGYIGDPTRTVRVGGREPQEIVLDLPASSVTRAPILRPFGVSAPDLVSFLFEAKLSRGLQERQWVGKGVRVHVLPSGQQITQVLFRQLVAELAKVGWATKAANRWELTVDPEDVAHRLQAQLQSVEPASPPRRKRA